MATGTTVMLFRLGASRRLLLATLIAIASITIVILFDIFNSPQHSVRTIVDASGHLWYARDNRTLYRTDLVNTHVVYRGPDGFRNREFHIFSPVIRDARAASPEEAAWKLLFGS